MPKPLAKPLPIQMMSNAETSKTAMADPMCVWLTNKKGSTVRQEARWKEQVQHELVEGKLYQERHTTEARTRFRSEFSAALRMLNSMEQRCPPEYRPTPENRETVSQWQ